MRQVTERLYTISVSDGWVAAKCETLNVRFHAKLRDGEYVIERGPIEGIQSLQETQRASSRSEAIEAIVETFDSELERESDGR